MDLVSFGCMFGLIVLLFLEMSPTAIAQMSKPIRLAPPTKFAPPDSSRQSPSRGSGDIAKPRIQGASKRITGGRVEVDNLEAVDASEVGILTYQTGALGGQMWRGTSGALVERLIGNLPTRAPSVAMRELMRRLLLSPSVAPEGISDPNYLISIRFNKLMTIGALDDASKLFDALPSARVAKLTALEVDLRFLANDNARACKLAEQEIAIATSPFWQKSFTFCSILKGEKEKALLSLSLMRELGEEDQTFLALAEGLILGEDFELSEMDNPSPLHLAMSRVGNVQLPGSVISSNIPSVLRAIAMSPKASIELRLEAGERADEAGALPVDVLRQMYASVTFSEEDLANPLSRAEIEFGPMVRALLFRTSLAQTIPIAQAEAAARAFALARDEGRYISTVHVFWPILKRIEASNELLWFAPEALRALLLVGDRDAALPWYQILQASAARNADAAKAIALFGPLAHLFEFDAARQQNTDQLVSSWWAAIQDQPESKEKAMLLFTVLESLGLEISEKSWQPLIGMDLRSQKTMPSVGLLNRLRRLTVNAEMMDVVPITPNMALISAPEQVSALVASVLVSPAPDLTPVQLQEPARPLVSKRVGETVLLSLLAIGDVGPAKIEVGVLSTVLMALSSVGLKADARALALEAALTNGL